MITEREKIISLARECNIKSIKEPRYHRDIYELTGSAIIAFYKAAQNEAIAEYEKKLHKEQLDRVAQIRPEKYMLMKEKGNE